MIRSGNPALNDKMFRSFHPTTQENRMTLQGTVNKTLIALLCVAFTASFTWNQALTNPGSAKLWIGVGFMGGLIAAIATVFRPTWSPFTTVIYALLEGLALGGISAIFELRYPGIAFQAIMLTFTTLGCLLLAYKSGLIKATENFKLGIVAATGAIFMFYMISMIAGMFGFSMPLIHDTGILGICFSGFVVVIAALNLVLDFDFIEHGAETGAPKYMEWYGAFGLMVTLIWLYIEILHLLAKLRSR